MKIFLMDRSDRKNPKGYELRKVLFARLANIPSLAALPKQEKRTLVREAKRAGITPNALGLLRILKMPPVPAEAQQAWGMKTRLPLAWRVMFEVHPWVRQLPALFDREDIRLPVPPRPAPYQLYRLDQGSLAKELRVDAIMDTGWFSNGDRKFVHDASPCEILLDDFADSLKENPTFPYHRCPECKAFFVVPRKRGNPQRYCSSRCTRQAAEARRDPDERRAYQRQLMRDRRKHGKEPKRVKKKSHTAAVKSRGTSQRKYGAG